MKRQILCLLLALALPFTLCACGSTRNGYMNDMPDPEDGYIERDRADDGVVDDDVRDERLPGSGTTGRSGNTTGSGTTDRGGNTTGSATANGSGNGTGMTGGAGGR